MLLHKRTLDLNADCTEFCPINGHHDLLAVGTYQLDEATQQRHGRLYAFSVNTSASEGVVVQEDATLDTSGIFNMRWLANLDTPTVALACASGAVNLVELHSEDRITEADAHSSTQENIVRPDDEDRARCTLRQSASEMVFQNSMAASVAVDTHQLGRLCTTSSGGEAACLQVREGATDVTAKWGAHDLEAWNCCFDIWQEQLVYTGGDDSAFKGWDLRQDSQSPTFCNRKAHSAGVCYINCNPHVENHLVTGSYDEHVRLWDTRKLIRPISELNVGGGAWTLKWHPHRSGLLLAACMQNGFSVLEQAGGSLKLSYEYVHQKTLGYGADWSHADCLPMAATASFYDKLLHIWQPNLSLSDNCD